jgi:hypothetical protein
LKIASWADVNFFYAICKKQVLLLVHFQVRKVSFFNSDMYQAVFQSKHYCSLEKGSSWNPCWDWNEFKQELKIRGALNVDTIECKNI